MYFGTIEPSTPRACPVCNTDRHAAFLQEGAWRLVRCSACPMVFLLNPPAYESLVEEHAWEASKSQERAERVKREPTLHWMQSRMKPLRRRLRPDRLRDLAESFGFAGRVLDVGCGTGSRTLKKLPAGITPFGVEIEPGPAAEADRRFRERGGYAVTAPVSEGLARFDDASMDASLAYAYFEHETQPGPVLAGLARVLKPGAPLILKTPNFGSVNRRIRGRRWCGYRWPDHVNQFTPRTMADLLGRHGFEVARSTLRDHLPTSDNLWMVARRAA